MVYRFRQRQRVLIAGVLVAVGCFFVLPSTSAQSQDHTPSKPDAPEIRQRALSTVDYVAGLVANLPQPESRIWHSVTLGEILWGYDCPRARDYFQTAFSLIDEVKIETGPEGQRAQAVEQRLRQRKRQLRAQVLRRIAGVDAELAKQFIREMKEKSSGSSWMGGSASQAEMRAEEILELAEIFLELDREQAVALAEESLGHGVSEALPSFLADLRQTDPAAANNLFDLALQAAANSNGEVSALMALASYVIPDPAAPANEAGAGSVLDPAQTTRLLGALASALAEQAAPLGDSSGAGDSGAGSGWSPAEQAAFIQQHLPFFQEFLPQSVPTLLNVAYQLAPLEAAKHEPPSAGNAASPAGGLREGRPSGSGGLSPEARDPRVRDQRLAQQAVSLALQGEVDEAKRILTKIGSEQVRNRARELVNTEATMKAIDDGDFLGARQYAQAVSQVKHRAAVFSMAAEKLSKLGESDQALFWLEEAYAYAARMDASREKASSLVLIVETILPVHPPRAFEMTQTLVTTLNRVQPAAGKQYRERQRPVTHAPGTLVDESLERIFDALGRIDFDQALYLAMQLENTEDRVRAELAICRSILADELSADRMNPERSN